MTTTTHYFSHFTGLQLLRFVAAMLVVVMHTSEAFLLRIAGTDGSEYWNGGSAGVDLFFVISGFVMALSTARIPADRASRLKAAWLFMKRRFVRIAPLYWFYLLLKTGLVLALPALALRTSIDPEHLLASFLFIPAVSPWGLIQPVLPVGWTLNFEMLFYAVFALAIALGLARVWFTLVLLGLVYAAGQLFPEITLLRFYAQTLIFEFVLGIVVAQIYMRYRQVPPEAGLALIAAGAVVMFLVDWGVDADRFSTWGIGAALMVMGAVWLEPWVAHAKNAPRLSFLGDASYSIYLSHTFIVPGAVLVLKTVGVQDPLLVMLAVCLLVVVAGCYSYVWIERPLTRLFKWMVIGPSPQPANAGVVDKKTALPIERAERTTP